MTRVCPDCRGTGKSGRKPCPTCNPPGGILDGPTALLRRAGNAVTGKKATVDTGPGGRRTTTTRAGWTAPEVVKTTGRKPAKPKTTKKTGTKRRTAPASTPTPVQLPKCDRCDTRGPLTSTRAGMTCLGGCKPANPGD